MKFLIHNLTLNDGITVTVYLPDHDIDMLKGSLQHYLYQQLTNHESKDYRKWNQTHRYQTELI